ncbi:keratin, type I cytoskeletal 17-like [Mobula hypostoma]|uniref:keratin, type I cytoskeletal 17-like n=1 Tax=Mobula hypostoma TaxID=723540 RepID=UPI002FC28841
MSYSAFSNQSYGAAGRKSGSVILGGSSRTVRSSVAGGSVRPRRATSVHNASTRHSRISSSGYGGGYSGGFYSGGYGGHGSAMLEPFAINEKLTMQNLNDRLAGYLANVRALEKSNSQLELQIREYYEKRSPAGTKDLGAYWKTIQDLRAQINAASLANAKVLLQIDNAKLAADDFRTKYDSELVIRRGVEMDISGLRKVLDELTVTRSDLESQIEAMKEEQMYLKKNHEEELKSLRSQLRGNVTVDVDAAPGTDLTKVLDEMREKYEIMAAKNQKEAEAWYKEQSATLQQTMTTSTQIVGTEKEQLTENRRKLQAVEIELQTLLSVKSSLEDTLQGIGDRYAEQLYHLQDLLEQREADLAQIRADSRRQCQEYAQLLDIKTRLEMEIATYRRLLEGEDISYSTEIRTIETIKEPEVITKKKVVTITQTLVDGQIVESHQEVNAAAADPRSALGLKQAKPGGGVGDQRLPAEEEEDKEEAFPVPTLVSTASCARRPRLLVRRRCCCPALTPEEDGRGDAAAMELSRLLADIQKHYERIVLRSRHLMDGYCPQAPEGGEAELSDGGDGDCLQSARAELTDARRQWQSLQLETESLRALRKGLERSLRATEQRHERRVRDLAGVVEELEGELREVRTDIRRQVWKHELLLNTKMRLEGEIARYRGLLDGEEGSLASSGAVGSQSSHTWLRQKTVTLPSAVVMEASLEQRIETVATQEIPSHDAESESAKAPGKIQTEKMDELIKGWECSFFKDNPHLRKKSASLRFDLHLAAADEGTSPGKRGALPDIELRLVMRKSSSIPSLKS